MYESFHDDVIAKVISRETFRSNFNFENNFFEIIISKLFSTAQDQTKIWIRITLIREFPEDIQGQNKLDDAQKYVFYCREIFAGAMEKNMTWTLRNMSKSRIQWLCWVFPSYFLLLREKLTITGRGLLKLYGIPWE